MKKTEIRYLIQKANEDRKRIAEVLQSFVKSRVARIEMSPDKKQFKLKPRAFDPLYPDSGWWA